MNKMVLFFCIGYLPCGLLFVAPPTSADMARDVAARLDQTPPPHPRLLFPDEATAGLKAKIENDGLLAPAYGRLKDAADALLSQEPVKREKIGKRLLGVSRTCLQRVSYLAFAYRMTKEDVYLERAKREMLAAAAFEDWNPSHFLDVAEMTAALALGYDWLYSDLDAESRAAIRNAIVEKGLVTSMKGGSWVTGNSNWNQVCHGGLVLGALAVMEDHREVSERIITRAIENVPRSMGEYEPDGVYPEGPSYWEYGTTYNILMISALESALGSDFGLASAKGFLKTPDFYMHATGPTGLFFNFSDCGMRGGVAPAMYWFAERRKEPALLWREKKELALLANEDRANKGSGDRMLALLLIWAQPMREPNAPQALCWKGDGRTPVAMLQSSWQDTATYVGIKGGSPGTNHAHMDVGSFVLDAQGVRWALDLGSQNYNDLESRGIDLWNKRQESERWTVFRLNNHSHNTLVVDGQTQRVNGNATITRFSGDAPHPFAVVDISGVYEGQLSKALRGVRLVGESVLIQDEIKTLDRAASVRWAMATQAEVMIESGNTALLRQDGKTATLRVSSPANAKLAVHDIEKPPHDYDAANPNTRMVGFEASIDASTTVTWAVFIEPGTESSTSAALNPLDAW